MIAPFITVQELAARRDRVRLVDVRWYPDGSPGRAAHLASHIPGSVYLDMDTELSAPATAADGRHPLPTPEVFAAALGRAGIGPDDVVVAYDDNGGVFAARLAWMLRALGQPATVLSGGLAAWTGPLASGGSEPPEPTEVPVRRWPPERLATIDDAADAAALVLDARTAERFHGEPSPLDPRPGHIPGARSAPCAGNLDADGQTLPVGLLRERFAALGVTDARRVVAYCGSGVTACHNLLAMEHAGLGSARLYPGSWSQYAATDRPAALD